MRDEKLNNELRKKILEFTRLKIRLSKIRNEYKDERLFEIENHDVIKELMVLQSEIDSLNGYLK